MGTWKVIQSFVIELTSFSAAGNNYQQEIELRLKNCKDLHFKKAFLLCSAYIKVGIIKLILNL